MSDANDSPVGMEATTGHTEADGQMTVAQHGEAPTSLFEQAEARQGADRDKPLSTSLYCDRMDDKKSCCMCGRGTHLRFQRPGYPDVIAYFWKCRRCIRKGTSSEKDALERMIFRDKQRLHRYLTNSAVEVGELTD